MKWWMLRMSRALSIMGIIRIITSMMRTRLMGMRSKSRREEIIRNDCEKFNDFIGRRGRQRRTSTRRRRSTIAIREILLLGRMPIVALVSVHDSHRVGIVAAATILAMLSVWTVTMTMTMTTARNGNALLGFEVLADPAIDALVRLFGLVATSAVLRILSHAAAAVAISIDVATSEKDTPPLRIQAAATAIGRTARHRQTRRNQLMMTTSVRPRRTARSRQLVQIMKIPHVEKAVQGRAVLLVVDVGSGDGAVGGGGAAGPGGVGRATARGGGLGMTAGGGAGSGGCLALHCGCWSQCVRVFERVRNSKQCLHSMRSSVFRRGCRGGFSSGWDG
mmetsp:Transcript_16374/g.32746  ORF Transcript_16374/g.32746 Transcript_16374/m.32746 type:complete len:334 (-) Transcript_16374:236-1237(-)